MTLFLCKPASAFFSYTDEGPPGVLGNKGTLAKYRREQGNISQFLGTGEQNFEKLQNENILRECGNMGTWGNFGREQGNKDPPWETLTDVQ